MVWGTFFHVCPFDKGGGVLKLFGQCPYRTNTFQKGVSLKWLMCFGLSAVIALSLSFSLSLSVSYICPCLIFVFVFVFFWLVWQRFAAVYYYDPGETIGLCSSCKPSFCLQSEGDHGLQMICAKQNLKYNCIYDFRWSELIIRQNRSNTLQIWKPAPFVFSQTIVCKDFGGKRPLAIKVGKKICSEQNFAKHSGN